ITHPRILIFASIFLSATPLSGKKDESMKARQPVVSVFWCLCTIQINRQVEQLPTCLMCVCLKTAYLHAHFNKITKISKQDFTDMGNIELITYRANPFSTSGYTTSQCYVFVFFNFFLQNNNISTITDEMFCKGDTSHYLRSNLDRVRLNGNPIKLSGYPNGFIRLQSLAQLTHKNARFH
uniref:Uncharacterized protein n=1 Tax=Poecilia latipinna TaxID=48699 RepID=A0A3B3W384_9TELE